MIKKIVVIGIILIIFLPLVSCNNNYKYKESDFSLVINVDKTEVNLGDTIKINAELKNLSGKNISIQMNHPENIKLEDIISIGVFKENESHDFIMTSIYGPRKKLTIKKDAIVSQTIYFTIDENINYDVTSLVVFFTGKDYKNQIAIHSEVKKIIIKN